MGWHADYSNSGVHKDGRPAQHTNRVGVCGGKGAILYFRLSQKWYEADENGKSVLRHRTVGSYSFEIPNGLYTYILSNKGGGREREEVNPIRPKSLSERLKGHSESEITAQEASTLAKVQRRSAYEAEKWKAKQEAKKKEAAEKGLEPPRTYSARVPWEDRYREVVDFLRTHKRLPRRNKKCKKEYNLKDWMTTNQQLYKAKKPKQSRIDLLRDIGVSQCK